MDNEYEKIFKDKSMEDIKIENNLYLGQEEGDFEEVFEETFKKEAFNKEDHEECQEMLNKLYYLKSSNFIPKEEPQHICQPNYFLKTLSKINLNENINDEINEIFNFKLNDEDKDQNYLICENDSIEPQKSELIIKDNLAEKEEEIEEEKVIKMLK